MYSRNRTFFTIFEKGTFLYVLPYGQMSLWGFFVMPQMFLLYFLAYSTLQRSTAKLVRLKGEYRIGPHNKDILSIIFGSLLGDGYAEKRNSGTGTRICFYQEHSHVEYSFYLHSFLSQLGYCNVKEPTINTRLGIGGKVRKVVRFRTWTYTSFNWIHDLWYVNGVKKIPSCISEYLTPMALAIWIMDDGGKVGDALKFSTNSYTYSDCLVLVNALNTNFKIKSSIQKAGADNQYIIYVWKESMPSLREIVRPYIIPGMKYKVGM